MTRQNTLIDDILGENKNYILLLGSFEPTSGFPKGYDKILNVSEFSKLESLPLHKIFPEEYLDGEMYLRLAIRTSIWRKNTLDKLLLALAKDEVTNVMIIGDVDLDKLDSLISELDKKFGRTINYVAYDYKEFLTKKKKKDGFIMDVLKDKKIMLIGDKLEFRKA